MLQSQATEEQATTPGDASRQPLASNAHAKRTSDLLTLWLLQGSHSYRGLRYPEGEMTWCLLYANHFVSSSDLGVIWGSRKTKPNRPVSAR